MLNAALDDGVVLANPANKLGKVLRLARSKATRQEEIKALDMRAAIRVSGEHPHDCAQALSAVFHDGEDWRSHR
jgi:hypothetical protein